MSEADFYHTNGYWVARGLLSAGAIDAALEDLRAIFNAQARHLGVVEGRTTASADIAALLQRVFDADTTAYRAAARLLQWSISLQQLAICTPFLEVAHALGLVLPVLATRPVLHIMGATLGIPGANQTTPRHQDWRAVQGSMDQLNIWLPLHDIDPANYPLQIVPGSHRLGLLESEAHPFGHRVVDGAIDDGAFVSLPMRAGDAVFFSGFLVHRTGPAGPRGDVRLSASFRFNNAADPEFVRRGYPIPYFQTDMSMLPGAPAPEAVAAFFDARVPTLTGAEDARRAHP